MYDVMLRIAQAHFSIIVFCNVNVYPPLRRKRIVLLCFRRDVRTRLEVAISEVSGPPVFHIKVARALKCLVTSSELAGSFSTTSPNAERQAGKL